MRLRTLVSLAASIAALGTGAGAQQAPTVNSFTSVQARRGAALYLQRCAACHLEDLLWQVRLGTSVLGFPVTYSVNGRQYVAVTSGMAGSPLRPLLTPEVAPAGTGSAVYVFELLN